MKHHRTRGMSFNDRVSNDQHLSRTRCVAVVILIAMVAGIGCGSDEASRPLQPGPLNGLWDGVAFDYASEPENPPTRITISIIHEGDAITSEWIHPGWGARAAAWDGDTLSMWWSDRGVTTEFRAGLSSANRLEGRWIVSSKENNSSSDWHAERQ